MDDKTYRLVMIFIAIAGLEAAAFLVALYLVTHSSNRVQTLEDQRRVFCAIVDPYPRFLPERGPEGALVENPKWIDWNEECLKLDRGFPPIRRR